MLIGASATDSSGALACMLCQKYMITMIISVATLLYLGFDWHCMHRGSIQ